MTARTLALAGLIGAPADEPELALRQGKYFVPRLLPWARGGHLAMPRAVDFNLEPTERGAIDNLCLVQTHVPPPAAGQVQIRVEAAGLNFRDVLNVLGLYPGDPGRVGGGEFLKRRHEQADFMHLVVCGRGRPQRWRVRSNEHAARPRAGAAPRSTLCSGSSAVHVPERRGDGSTDRSVFLVTVTSMTACPTR